jgi:HSP20 family protein
MSLVRFTPRTLDPWFGASDKVFDDFFRVPARNTQAGRAFYPSVDIKEDDKQIVLTSDLPGIDQKDIKVTVEDGTLTLSGERKFEKSTDEENFHRVERSFGSFERSFSLPETVDEDKIVASYKNGVLELTLPKTKPDVKQVKVVSVN